MMRSPILIIDFIAIFLSLPYISLPLASAKCYSPSPAYMPPRLSRDHPLLSSALLDLERKLSLQPLPGIPVADFKFSVELTSTQETLWSFHRSSSQDESNVRPLDEHSIYRMASITKVFTVYAVLIAAAKGLLDLDNPITHYIEELNASKHVKYNIISLGSLGSQLSGIARESQAMTDKAWGMDVQLPDPIKMGYPPVDPSDKPTCGNPDKLFDCSRKELLDELVSQPPAFSPNFKSSYSNIAFVLLGLALENVTGKPYNNVMQSWVFDRLNMTDASIEKPDDARGVTSGGNLSSWGTDAGFYNATGGMYSSTDSLSRFMRHILGSPDFANAWLRPTSFTPGGLSAYGMPWEILHSPRFLPAHGNRPLTFYTKSGNLNGYSTNMLLLPEQGIGISILTASILPYILSWVRDHVTSRLIPTIEDIALEQTAAQYAGTYHAGPSLSLNSSLTLSVTRTKGLHITRWISNSTNFLAHFERINQGMQPRPAPPGSFHTQLIPSLLREQLPPLSRSASTTSRANETGEMWHVHFAPHRDPHILLWDDFCLEDIGGFSYAGLQANKIVFEIEDSSTSTSTSTSTSRTPRRAKALHIPGLRVRLQRVTDDPFVHGDSSMSKPESVVYGKTARAKEVFRAVYRWAVGVLFPVGGEHVRDYDTLHTGQL